MSIAQRSPQTIQYIAQPHSVALCITTERLGHLIVCSDLGNPRQLQFETMRPDLMRV